MTPIQIFSKHTKRKSSRLLVPILLSIIGITGCSSDNSEDLAPQSELSQQTEQTADSRPKPSPIPVIFDTDMAIDDWSALLFLQKHPRVDLLAVTVAGSGESHCEPGQLNALALLDLADASLPVPVACGDPIPLEGYFVFPVPWQEDMDRLSGVPVVPSARSPYEGHAVELIHQQIVDSDEPVVILATGPMTNLAQWLEKYPQDIAKVSRVVLMGGAIDAPGNIIVPGFTDNNPNKHAEWNFYVDPLAAKIVLESELQIELVGLDVTNHVLVTSEFADYFKSVVDNPAAEFWDAVLDANDWFIDSNEYYFWDVLAALVVIQRADFCQGDRAALSAQVEYTESPWLPTSDMSIADLNWQGEPRRHLEAASAGVVTFREQGEKNSLICRETNARLAFDEFVKTLIDAKQLPEQPEYRVSPHLSQHPSASSQTDTEAHMQYPYVFHLVQTRLWNAAVASDESYYPPTYEADGFTHGTSNPDYLLTIGNHFYQDVPGDWGLLRMSVESLAATGVETVFEGTAPVGDKQPDFEGSDSELFPHIKGGIHPQAVLELHAMTRTEDGTFVSISNLPVTALD